jgi:hypothetical protein
MPILNFFLIIVGLLACVHLICTAAFLTPRAPLTVIAEVTLGFASSVGVVITSVHDDADRALMFCGMLVLCLVLFSIEKILRGTLFRLGFNHHDKTST